MDVYCPKCAEPIDNDTIHDTAEEWGTTYSKIAAEFRVKGCEAVGYSCNPETAGSFRAQVADAMYDLNGEDMDGTASMMEDFEYFGMI